MKKIYIVLQDKDALSALDRLREFGAVHIEHTKKPDSEKVAELQERLKIAAQAVSVLSQIKHPVLDAGGDGAAPTAEDVVQRLGEITRLKEGMYKRQSLIAQWEPWGGFDPQEIQELEQQGVFLQLYEMSEEDKRALPEDVVIEEVSTTGKVSRCVVASLKPLDIPSEPVALPQASLAALNALQREDRNKIIALEKSLEKDAGCINELRSAQKDMEDALAFHQAESGRGEQRGLAYYKGFCPKDQCSALKDYAGKNQWAILIEDPAEGDAVPTLLRNPKWVELIKPVFDLINVLPGYKEADVSVIFLFFFSIFFGMLIGDTGYGLVFGLITFYVQVKMGGKVKDKTPFALMYILSFMAIGWGALTGTYFGQKWIAPHIPALMPWLTDGTNVQKVCFFLGALHLSLAHAWRAALQTPSLTALAELGWVVWIWGMFFLVRLLITEVPMPAFGPFLMILGALLAILFSAPNKNIFKMLLGGISAFMGSFINAFTDVISYIRLFAVGLATVAIADAFNDIALGVGCSNILTSFATALILFVGHALNLVLAAMAILVHGLRLNVLEFSNHMGVQWAGIKFTPFKKNTH